MRVPGFAFVAPYALTFWFATAIVLIMSDHTAVFKGEPWPVIFIFTLGLFTIHYFFYRGACWVTAVTMAFIGCCPTDYGGTKYIASVEYLIRHANLFEFEKE